nr:MAG TPA: hypothetical protein [Bacteriophage sp.]DAX15234.1 MAG TPA: hypothetical protein [Bacteriophage sp.]
MYEIIYLCASVGIETRILIFFYRISFIICQLQHTYQRQIVHTQPSTIAQTQPTC